MSINAFTNKHTRKNIAIFNFTTTSQSLATPPTIPRMERVHDPDRELSMCFNVKTIIGGYITLIKACGSLLAEELPCQSEWANSEDPFAVVVMAGELIVGPEKFLQFAQCFYNKMVQISAELLDPWLDDNVLGFLNLLKASHFWKKNFCKPVFGHENHENFCLAKISRYTMLLPTVLIRPATWLQFPSPSRPSTADRQYIGGCPVVIAQWSGQIIGSWSQGPWVSLPGAAHFSLSTCLPRHINCY